MKKICLCTAIFVAFCLCISSTATATLFNQMRGGDRVVYDDVSKLIWYPILTDFTGKTLDQQLTQIDALEYGGSTDWEMATWTQTSKLKASLMGMATEQIMPTKFGPDFGTPVYTDRNISSPFLAWDVDSEAFFTPTGTIDLSVIGVVGGGVMFNGRTNGYGMTNTGPGGFNGEVVWDFLPADDHWVSISYMNDGDDYLTFLGNFDQHYRDPSATVGPGESIGAWAVAPAPVPEPATMLLFGTGLAGLAGYRRRQQAKKK